MNKINKFEGEYFFLSNFYISPVRVFHRLFTNAEAAFQSMKCESESDRNRFVNLGPSEAKKLGRSVELVSNWEEIKDSIMYEVCFQKFYQNYELRKKLMETYPLYLEEGNSWGDTVWGVCNGKGDNRLGKILMKIRYALLLAYDTEFPGQRIIDESKIYTLEDAQRLFAATTVSIFQNKDGTYKWFAISGQGESFESLRECCEYAAQYVKRGEY